MAHPVEAFRRSPLWWFALPIALVVLIALALIVAAGRTLHRASLWAAERILDAMFS